MKREVYYKRIEDERGDETDFATMCAVRAAHQLGYELIRINAWNDRGIQDAQFSGNRAALEEIREMIDDMSIIGW